MFQEKDLRGSSTVLMDSRTALPLQTGTDGSLFINGVKVITTDIPATNGIIHVINDVIPNQVTRHSFTTAKSGNLNTHFL